MILHRLQHARLAVICMLLVVGMLVLAPTEASAASLGCADDASSITDHTATWEAELLQLTNAHRTRMGLAALQLDTTLTRDAVWKARDMARRNYFAHDDPASTRAPARSPWIRLTACGWTTGGQRAENIAAGYVSPQDVITGWLNSPGHRANIETPAMRYVGFGVASSTSSRYGTYSVQVFASTAGPASTTPISMPTSGAGDVRDPYDQPDGAAATPAATAIADPVVRVTRTRCHSMLAVNGWCWRIVVRARVSSLHASERRVVISRRTASGRLVRVASLTTTATARVYRSTVLHPPAHNTAAWLRRNASSYRIAVARTSTATGAVRSTTARIAAAR